MLRSNSLRFLCFVSLLSSWIDHAVIIWEEREGGFKSLATPERNEQGFLDTNVANAASGAGELESF
jgi:hypothetical protein